MNDMIYMKYMNFLYILLGEEVSQEKLGELRIAFLQMFGETWPNKLLLLPKKVFITSFNKKVKRLSSCLPVLQNLRSKHIFC